MHQIKFGTDGWRAHIAKEFTASNLALLCAGLAGYLQHKYPAGTPIVIGYDARFFADRFAAQAADIMQAFGIPVLMVEGHVPTPVIAHAAREHNSCGCMMFTASHNPPEYMGVKYIPEYAGPATVEITNAILEQVDKLAPQLDIYNLASLTATELAAQVESLAATKAGSAGITSINPFDAYMRDLRAVVDFDSLRKLNSEKQLTVAYDAMYGCGRGFTDRILEDAGFKVITLHGEQDYSFGGSLPEPVEKLLGELKTTVTSEGAAFGAANDGDADRFAMLAEDASFFPPNKSLSIILKYLIEKRGLKGVVARTVVTTHLLDEIAAKFGFETLETAVGFKWVGEIMRERDTIIACEESGGMSVLGHIPEKDGILAILMMAEVLAATGKTLLELWDEVQDFVGKRYYYHRLDLHFDGDLKTKFVEAFRDPGLKEIAGYKVVDVTTKEGSKVYLDNGAWFLARPSGTEAMCRVYIEANSEEVLTTLKQALELKVDEISRLATAK